MEKTDNLAILDYRIRGEIEMSTYQEYYIDQLKKLYKKYGVSSENDREFALDYAKMWWSENNFLKHSPTFQCSANDGFVCHVDFAQFQNIALLRPQDSLSYYVKRSLLLADLVLLYDHNLCSEKKNLYPLFSYIDSIPPNASAQTSIDYTAFLNISDVDQLGEFLRNNKELVLSKRVVYYPNIKVDIHTDTYYNGSEYTTENPSQDEFEQLIGHKNNISSSISRRLVEDRYLRIVAEIEIPYFDGQNNSTIVKILKDNEESLSILRKNLKRCFLDLYAANGSELFDDRIHRIGLEIQDGIDEIHSEMKKMRRHTLFQVGSGLVIGTVVATLVAINDAALSSNTITQLLTYLGTGGGVISISKFLEDYLNKKQMLSERPYYFLWLFHKK